MIIRNKLTLSNSIYNLSDKLIWKNVWGPACECIDVDAAIYVSAGVNRILWRGVADCVDALSINVNNKMLQKLFVRKS